MRRIVITATTLVTVLCPIWSQARVEHTLIIHELHEDTVRPARMKPPEIESKIYPFEARLSPLACSVELQVLITPEGKGVPDAVIDNSCEEFPAAFETAARLNVARQNFEPARQGNGKAVYTKRAVKVRFPRPSFPFWGDECANLGLEKMVISPHGLVSRSEMDVLKRASEAGVARRIARSWVAPRFPDAAKIENLRGTVILGIVIDDEQGKAKPELTRDTRSGYGFATAVMDAVEKWRYNPALDPQTGELQMFCLELTVVFDPFQ